MPTASTSCGWRTGPRSEPDLEGAAGPGGRAPLASAFPPHLRCRPRFQQEGRSNGRELPCTPSTTARQRPPHPRSPRPLSRIGVAPPTTASGRTAPLGHPAYTPHRLGRENLLGVLLQLLSVPSVRTVRPHGLQPPGSSAHGILQARMLGWAALSSGASSPPADRARVGRASRAGRRALDHHGPGTPGPCLDRRSPSAPRLLQSRSLRSAPSQPPVDASSVSLSGAACGF